MHSKMLRKPDPTSEKIPDPDSDPTFGKKNGSRSDLREKKPDADPTLKNIPDTANGRW